MLGIMRIVNHTRRLSLGIKVPIQQGNIREVLKTNGTMQGLSKNLVTRPLLVVETSGIEENALNVMNLGCLDIARHVSFRNSFI